MSRRMSESASLKSFDSIPTMADVEATLGCVDMNQRYELVSGRLVSFAEVGHPCGHPVFCFLGLGCMRYYSIILEDLAFKHSLRIYCIDRPGVGMSQPAEPESWTPLRMAEIVEEMANGFNIQKFSLMGHSCGAIYAMACALRLKSRVVGTVWLMSPWVHLTLAKRMKWIKHVPTTLLKSQSTASLLYKSLSVGAKEPLSKSDPNILSYDREKLVKAMLQDNLAESLEGANNDLMVCLELYHSFGFSYKDVTLPVHVFWGTKDAVISREAVDWMEQRLPQCTLSVIDGGTHGLLWRADVVSKIFKGIASSWKLAEFERALTQRWSIKQLGLRKNQSFRGSTYSAGLQQAIQTSNIYEAQSTLYQSQQIFDDPDRF
ncbi:hypothetical protein BGZ98_002436 [Dissophora globulifera]|uniref:Serine aminopeptidase S33 domain-containing protein n=1 Tax=Dissophora globulifera TaxID=979702 RepID=A0A9P6RYK1_9FUNG|nr:hypothetical protein BGZ98_002436 [Dissophora globulifera]KAG0329773.1 hypothetical protein BGZ99_000509 [Dissophora globulifera]